MGQAFDLLVLYGQPCRDGVRHQVNQPGLIIYRSLRAGKKKDKDLLL